uniref:Uncharacterized protein n=1 Tax=Arundo donax TaxID=35708 RepID=A0A0A9A4R6_ARUDO
MKLTRTNLYTIFIHILPLQDHTPIQKLVKVIVTHFLCTHVVHHP